MEKFGFKFYVVEEKGFIKEFYVRKIGLCYYFLVEGYKKNVDFYIFDEVVGIYVFIFYKYFNKLCVVYFLMIYGYEGVGRGFLVKFLKKVREKCFFKEFYMEELIRYVYGDLIEKWFFDVFLFDVEFVELIEEDYELIKWKEVYLEELDFDDWFENDREDFRYFVGIYILVYYCNRLSDVVLLVDVFYYEVRVFCLKNGKIVMVV